MAHRVIGAAQGALDEERDDEQRPGEGPEDEQPATPAWRPTGNGRRDKSGGHVSTVVDKRDLRQLRLTPLGRSSRVMVVTATTSLLDLTVVAVR